MFYVGAVQIGARASLNTMNLDDPHPRYGYFLHGIVPSLRGLVPLARWDSIWYVSIARDGYGYSCPTDHDSNTAFFPLYPLTMRIVSSTFHVELTSAGAWISRLCLLATLMMIFFGFGRRWSRLIGLLAFPAAFMLVAVYAESLFLALSLGSFLLFKRGNNIGSFVLSFLAGLARPEALALGGFLVTYTYIHRWKSDHDIMSFAPSLGAFEGVYAFMAYFHLKFGNMFLFFISKKNFNPQSGPHWISKIHVFFRLWAFHHSRIAAITPTLEIVMFIIAVAALAHFIRRGKFPEAAYIAAFVASVVASGSVWGVARRSLSAFPLFELFQPFSEIKGAWQLYLLGGVAIQSLLLFFFVTFRFGLC